MFSMLCDLVNVILLILEAKYMSNNQANGAHSNQVSDEEDVNASVDNIQIEDDENIKKRLVIGVVINNCFYFLLWMIGHGFYYFSETNYFENAAAITDLVFLYLYCGYFYLACSILMAVLNQSYINFFTFSQSSLTRKASIKPIAPQVPVKLYTNDMAGPTECYICLTSYNNGDKIGELPCNSKHYFHRNCVNKWLKINNACPVCRKAVNCCEGPTIDEIELSVVV